MITSGNVGATPVAQPIQQASCDIANQLSNLSAVIDMLESRLVSVMRPEIGKPVDDTSPPRPVSAALTIELNKHAEAITLISGRVKSIISRLEV